MSALVPGRQKINQADLLIWPIEIWPADDRLAWQRSYDGRGLEGLDNPAVGWRDRTLLKNEQGYGRYLAWLHRQELLRDDEDIAERITPPRIASYVASLKIHLSSVSVAITVAALTSAARALAPDVNWSWLSRRSTRLKLKAKPSREKRHAIQHTLDLYRYGQHLMDTVDDGKRNALRMAQRYQAGLIIALLAARPLRIRNFQAITIGESLRWDGSGYWLTFDADDTKTGNAIDEPVPADLRDHLEAFLKKWRPILVRQAKKFGDISTHRRLWVDIFGKPMREEPLRLVIKCYTKQQFGTAVWPHLFRDCLLTSVAIDQPDLMRTSAVLLGHSSYKTGEKHYNQAHSLDASRRYGSTIADLRASFLGPTGGKIDDSAE